MCLVYFFSQIQIMNVMIMDLKNVLNLYLFWIKKIIKTLRWKLNIRKKMKH